MRNDQIFVLILVILLPMSGCFDGAVGDAEGSEEVVPTTNVEPELIHLYTESSDTIVANISVNSNQILEIVSANAIIVFDDDYSNNNPSSRSLYVKSASCYAGNEPVNVIPVSADGFVWKSDGPCDYTLGLSEGENYGISYSSIVYRLHTVL